MLRCAAWPWEGAFLGHPVEHLDRRQRIQEVLRTGQLPSEGMVRHDRRTNREVILPLGEGTHLDGLIVVVEPSVTDSSYHRHC
jgi:hypothetical protein